MFFVGGAVLVGKSRLSKSCKKMSGINNESKKCIKNILERYPALPLWSKDITCSVRGAA